MLDPDLVARATSLVLKEVLCIRTAIDPTRIKAMTCQAARLLPRRSLGWGGLVGVISPTSGRPCVFQNVWL